MILHRRCPTQLLCFFLLGAVTLLSSSGSNVVLLPVTTATATESSSIDEQQHKSARSLRQRKHALSSVRGEGNSSGGENGKGINRKLRTSQGLLAEEEEKQGEETEEEGEEEEEVIDELEPNDADTEVDAEEDRELRPLQTQQRAFYSNHLLPKPQQRVQPREKPRVQPRASYANSRLKPPNPRPIQPVVQPNPRPIQPVATRAQYGRGYQPIKYKQKKVIPRHQQPRNHARGNGGYYSGGNYNQNQNIPVTVIAPPPPPGGTIGGAQLGNGASWQTIPNPIFVQEQPIVMEEVATANPGVVDENGNAFFDIPTTAINAGIFTTLVTALSAAELVATLSGPGPFTVFAPNDSAFTALPTGVLNCLLQPKYEKTLQDLLLYHVANGEVLSSSLVDGQKITTLQGNKLTVEATSGVEVVENEEVVVVVDEGVVTEEVVVPVLIINAKITYPIIETTVVNGEEVFTRGAKAVSIVSGDVLATNGITHIINEVLIPPTIDMDELARKCRLSDIPLSQFNGYGKASSVRKGGGRQSSKGGQQQRQSYYGGGGKGGSGQRVRNQNYVGNSKGRSYRTNHGRFINGKYKNGGYYNNNHNNNNRGTIAPSAIDTTIETTEVIVVNEEEAVGFGNYVRVGTVDGVPIVLVRNQPPPPVFVETVVLVDEPTFETGNDAVNPPVPGPLPPGETAPPTFPPTFPPTLAA